MLKIFTFIIQRFYPRMEQIAEVADTLSHDDLMEVTKSSLTNILRSDSLLSDLPSDIILEEIISLVSGMVVVL